jgi:heme-degrading monooxygenase HmoA
MSAVHDPAGRRVRVLLFLRASDASDVSQVERGYHEISRELDGTPGLLGNELLADVTEPGSFAVLSEWRSMDAFREWEQGASHRQTTSPLRDYQDRGRDKHFGIYEVTAAY